MNTSRKILLAMGALGMGACATTQPAAPPPAAAPAAQAPQPPSTPDAEFRAQKPAPLPGTPHFEAPVPVEKKLKNGLTVLITENHQLPLVAAELLIKTGVDGNPLNKPGLAEFTAAMLTEGTQKRTATQLAEQQEDLALRLGANATLDSTRVHINSLGETLPQALDLMADVALHPAFRQADVDRVKKGYLTELAQRTQVPSFIAINTAAHALYGDKHPWGQPQGGTQASVSKLTPKDLTAFHAAWFVPQNAVLSISGDVKPDTLLPLLEKTFGAWKGKGPVKKTAALGPSSDVRQVAVVDHPGSQSRVVIAHRLLSAADPDVVPFRTANYILGGLFTSRLNLNLREDKAFSYGVRSALQLNDKTGVFSAEGNIKAEHTAEAVAEMEKEFDRFSNGQVTPDELNAAKSAYVRSLPSLLETNDAASSSLATLVLQGLPTDYYAKLPAQVEQVTAADVARVAQKYVKPAAWSVVVVGPMGNQTDKLTALNLGPVQVLPAPGTPPPAHGSDAAHDAKAAAKTSAQK